jgi:hypothetical protein
VELDYSVESLKEVDQIIEGFREEGVEPKDVACTLFQFGCYVGEVFVRHAKGRWRGTRKSEMDIIGFPLVVDLPNKVTANPIGKVFKRMEYGMEDFLPYFYHAMTKAE